MRVVVAMILWDTQMFQVAKKLTNLDIINMNGYICEMILNKGRFKIDTTEIRNTTGCVIGFHLSTVDYVNALSFLGHVSWFTWAGEVLCP